MNYEKKYKKYKQKYFNLKEQYAGEYIKGKIPSTISEIEALYKTPNFTTKCFDIGFRQHHGECWNDSIQMFFVSQDKIKEVVQRKLYYLTPLQMFKLAELRGRKEKCLPQMFSISSKYENMKEHLLNYLTSLKQRFIIHYDVSLNKINMKLIKKLIDTLNKEKQVYDESRQQSDFNPAIDELNKLINAKDSNYSLSQIIELVDSVKKSLMNLFNKQLTIIIINNSYEYLKKIIKENLTLNKDIIILINKCIDKIEKFYSLKSILKEKIIKLNTLSNKEIIKLENIDQGVFCQVIKDSLNLELKKDNKDNKDNKETINNIISDIEPITQIAGKIKNILEQIDTSLNTKILDYKITGINLVFNMLNIFTENDFNGNHIAINLAVESLIAMNLYEIELDDKKQKFLKTIDIQNNFTNKKEKYLVDNKHGGDPYNCIFLTILLSFIFLDENDLKIDYSTSLNNSNILGAICISSTSTGGHATSVYYCNNNLYHFNDNIPEPKLMNNLSDLQTIKINGDRENDFLKITDYIMITFANDLLFYNNYNFLIIELRSKIFSNINYYILNGTDKNNIFLNSINDIKKINDIEFINLILQNLDFKNKKTNIYDIIINNNIYNASWIDDIFQFLIDMNIDITTIYNDNTNILDTLIDNYNNLHPKDENFINKKKSYSKFTKLIKKEYIKKNKMTTEIKNKFEQIKKLKNKNRSWDTFFLGSVQ